MNTKTQIYRVKWAAIGILIGLLPSASILGEKDALEEQNQILTSVLCSFPREELSARLNSIELPEKLLEVVGDKRQAVKDNIKQNILKECMY